MEQHKADTDLRHKFREMEAYANHLKMELNDILNEKRGFDMGDIGNDEHGRLFVAHHRT